VTDGSTMQFAVAVNRTLFPPSPVKGPFCLAVG